MILKPLLFFFFTDDIQILHLSTCHAFKLYKTNVLLWKLSMSQYISLKTVAFVITEDMNNFLKSYFQKFAYKSITSYDFQSSLYEYFHSKKLMLDSVDWDGWFHSPGMPPTKMV